MLFAPAANAAVVAPASTPRDVALQKDGVLVGHVVDAQGAVLAEAPVSIRLAGKEIARVQSDKNGQFSVPNLKGGVYEVATVGSNEVYRAWAPRTAPPVAQKGVLMVANGDVVRGQYGGPLGWMAAHPIATGAIVATAIAVPLALDDDDDPASP
jgi:hypothetical protein